MRKTLRRTWTWTLLAAMAPHLHFLIIVILYHRKGGPVFHLVFPGILTSDRTGFYQTSYFSWCVYLWQLLQEVLWVAVRVQLHVPIIAVGIFFGLEPLFKHFASSFKRLANVLEASVSAYN